MAKFVLTLTFDKDNEKRMSVRPAHRVYLRQLFDQGKLIMAGPYADESGALLVYEAADEAEMRSIIAADPYTDEVRTIVALRQWNTIFPQ